MNEDISPNVKVFESNYIANTNINPTQNIALFIGEFEKGNINEPVLITDILQFKLTFGRATESNYNSWYQVYNYLIYPGAPKIWVCRVGANSTFASNNGNIANSPGDWGNLITVGIYNKNEYLNSNYLKEVFNFYDYSEIKEDYLVIIKRIEQIVETFNISSVEDLDSLYINNINLEPGIYKLNSGLTVPARKEEYIEAFEIFTKEDYEIDIVISAEEYNEATIEFVESRKDCVAFLSIPRRYVQYLLVNTSLLTTEEEELIVLKDYKLKNKLDETDYNNIKNYINSLKRSSYCFMSFGFKSQLDKFSDKRRIISSSGDLAGLKAAASSINAWSVGAGLERGRLKEYTDIPMKIPKDKSDELYKMGVNVVQNGVLMSQKMFVDEYFNINRMNHRNIFNYLERKCEKLLRRYVFDLNELKLRGIIARELKLLLEDMMLSRGIEAGKVIVSTNNEQNIIINIYIKMINIAEIVKIGLVNTGVNSVNISSEIQIKGL